MRVIPSELPSVAMPMTRPRSPPSPTTSLPASVETGHFGPPPSGA